MNRCCVSARPGTNLVGVPNDNTAHWRSLQALCSQKVGLRVRPPSVHIFCCHDCFQGRGKTCCFEHWLHSCLWCRAGYCYWYLCHVKVIGRGQKQLSLHQTTTMQLEEGQHDDTRLDQTSRNTCRRSYANELLHGGFDTAPF